MSGTNCRNESGHPLSDAEKMHGRAAVNEVKCSVGVVTPLALNSNRTLPLPD
jgi:hypothetical protein